VDAADHLFAGVVVRVRLPGVDDLHRTAHGRDLAQPREVAEQQVGAFVRRGAAREADREHVRVELGAGARLQLPEQIVLAAAVRVEDVVQRDADRLAQAEVVGAPVGQKTVEQRGMRLRRPRSRVDAVGDRLDLVPREHRPRHLAVTHRNRVVVVRPVERERRHVELAAQLAHPLQGLDGPAIEHLVDQIARKPVVAGRDGRVRREHAALPHGFEIVVVLADQLRDDERGMSLVHVVARDVAAGDGVDDRFAADPEQGFLRQPVALIAAVE
jgi:hypothetical protein